MPQTCAGYRKHRGNRAVHAATLRRCALQSTTTQRKAFTAGGAGIAPSQRRGARPMADSQGGRSAALALLEASREADDPFGNVERQPGPTEPKASASYRCGLS